eukprot:g20269.t1
MGFVDELCLIFALAQSCTLIGFLRPTYFVSVGYALSILLMSVVSAWRFRNILGKVSSLGCVCQLALLFLWSLRLAYFLLIREFLYPTFRRKAQDIKEQTMAFRIKCLVWPAVSCLYAAMFSPVVVALITKSRYTSQQTFVAQAIGVQLMIAGLWLEAVADSQKSQAKKRKPNQVVRSGVYAYVRCPNYLGEIILWLGHWLASLEFYEDPSHWLVSLCGLVCLVWIMIGSSKRLEKSQRERYAADLSFQHYVRTVPVLFPFLPIYTLQNWNFVF